MFIKNIEAYLERKNILKAFLLREAFKYKKNHSFNNIEIFIDRIKLVVGIIFFSFKFIRLKKNDIECGFIDPFSKNGNVSNLRKKFIKYYANENVEPVNYTDNIYIQDFNGFFKFLKLYIDNILLVSKCLLDFSDIKYMPLLGYFFNRTNPLLYQLKKIYIFNVTDSSNYLLIQELAKTRNIELYYVYSSGPISTFGKYDYFNDNINIILTSTVQKSELKFLYKTGWFFYKKKPLIWGNDNLEDNVKFLDCENNDIGLFSSADWARGKNGLCQDVNMLKINKIEENLAYTVFLEVLNELKKIQSRGLKVKIYFHPLEKKLFETHGIIPPYLEEFDFIDISDIKNNGISNYMESKIAIVIQSSILYVREDQGLKTYFFYDNSRIKDKRLFLNIKMLSDYRANAYKNGFELSKKLKEDLKV